MSTFEIRPITAEQTLDLRNAILRPGLPREQAEDLVHKAHQVCPYSNATRNNIDVRLIVA